MGYGSTPWSRPDPSRSRPPEVDYSNSHKSTIKVVEYKFCYM